MEPLNQKDPLDSLAKDIKDKLSDWEPSANVIEMIVRNTHDERSYSNILAWLMNPKAAHGFGKTFLQRFLHYAKEEAKKDEKPFCCKWEGNQWCESGADNLSAELEITREYRTVNRKFIDIVCEDNENKFVLCIENKVFSNENPAKDGEESGDTQLKQYTKHLKKKYGSEYSVVAIYLKQLGKGEKVPVACKEEKYPWHHVSYVAVVRAITDILDGYKPGEEASECLKPQTVYKYVAYQFRDLIIRTLMKPETLKKPEDADSADKFKGISRRNELIDSCSKIYGEYSQYFIKDYTEQLVEKCKFAYTSSIGGGAGRSNGFMRGGGANFQPENSIFPSLLGENGQWAYQLEVVKDKNLCLKLTIVEARAQAERVEGIANGLLEKRESKTFAPRLGQNRRPVNREEIETWNDFVVWKSKKKLTKDGTDFMELLKRAADAEKCLKKYLMPNKETAIFDNNDINVSEMKFVEPGEKWKTFRKKHEFFIDLIEDFHS